MGTSCCRSGTFAALSRAAAKCAAGRLRRMGLLPQAIDWAGRAAVCEACPLRTIHRGESYCGRPFLRQLDRDPAEEGCGCPTRAKAKSPGEHCPLDPAHRPATRDGSRCTCKWCAIQLRLDA